MDVGIDAPSLGRRPTIDNGIEEHQYVVLDDGVDAPASPRGQEIILDETLYAINIGSPATRSHITSQPLLDHRLKGKRRHLTVSAG